MQYPVGVLTNYSTSSESITLFLKIREMFRV